MSLIGKRNIEVPSGVTVDLGGDTISVKGPKGELKLKTYPGIEIKINDNEVEVRNPNPADRRLNEMHGTMRSHIYNMVTGVSKGFTKELQIFGTGYNVKEQSGKIVLNVGYCHSVEKPMPKGVSAEIKVPATRGNEVPAVFRLTGPDKQVLGQFAAEIRGVRPPEPYIGKGIRYADETVRRKVGKAFGA